MTLNIGRVARRWHGALAAQPNNRTSTEIVRQGTGGTMLAVPSALEGGQAFNVTWRSAT